jgi:hypothetical protein
MLMATLHSEVYFRLHKHQLIIINLCKKSNDRLGILDKLFGMDKKIQCKFLPRKIEK